MENSKFHKVLLTASGLSPVGLNTINSLTGRVQKIIGVDLHDESYARMLCSSYYKVPLANHHNYIPDIVSICLKENVDTILPLTIEETIILKRREPELNAIGVCIANGNSDEKIEICNDKFLTNQYLKK